MEIIGYIHTDFSEKFGIPRQSGLVEELKATITFLPKYRQQEAFRGLEAFTHIWLLWQFHKAEREHWSATVKPPKLGGNTRMGVFATRSPFRPNNIGLSSVKLDLIEYTEDGGPVLHVSGADLLDGTPIYDIKPYLAYTDSHPDAAGGWTSYLHNPPLTIHFPKDLLKMIPKDKQAALRSLLAEDPRPGYQNEPKRRYGIAFAGYDIRFYVDGTDLSVVEIIKLES